MHYLYARHVDDVFNYVQSIVRDHHEAEDITQNIFAKLITAIRQIRGALGPVRRLDHSGRSQRRPRPPARAPPDPGRGGAGQRPGRRPGRLGAPRCLRRRSARCRGAAAVLVLRHLSASRRRRSPTRLGKSESSIHGLHHRGRATLKASLIEQEAGPVTARAEDCASSLDLFAPSEDPVRYPARIDIGEIEQRRVFVAAARSGSWRAARPSSAPRPRDGIPRPRSRGQPWSGGLKRGADIATRVAGSSAS